jgi:hypothetical protein
VEDQQVVKELKVLLDLLALKEVPELKGLKAQRELKVPQV